LAVIVIIVLAVNAFTSGTLGTELDTLEFLDLDMASEIGRNACVTPTVVIMALVYLDRLSKSNPKYLTTVKPSELFVVALVCKYLGKFFLHLCNLWSDSSYWTHALFRSSWLVSLSKTTANNMGFIMGIGLLPDSTRNGSINWK